MIDFVVHAIGDLILIGIVSFLLLQFDLVCAYGMTLVLTCRRRAIVPSAPRFAVAVVLTAGLAALTAWYAPRYVPEVEEEKGLVVAVTAWWALLIPSLNAYRFLRIRRFVPKRRPGAPSFVLRLPAIPIMPRAISKRAAFDVSEFGYDLGSWLAKHT